MEVSDLLKLTPEQRAKRKEEFEKRKLLVRQGRNYDKEKAEERAKKALLLLKAHLDGTNTLEENYKVALCGIVLERSIDSFYFFCKYVLDMDLLSDITHKRWADDFQSAIMKDKKRLMRLKPRGTFKTSIYGIGSILWLFGCFSQQLRILYTSSNSLLLQEVSDKISQYIGTEKNETLYSLIFGVTKDTTAKNTSDVINIKGRAGKGFSLVFKTAGSSVIGSHPNYICVDDPMNEEDRTSQATRDAKELWMDSLIPLLVPFKDSRSGVTFETIVFIATRYHMKDLVNHILERNKKLPDDQKWDYESESICNDKGESNYPDFISNQKISELKNSMSEVSFSCQYANNPLMDGMQMFDLKRLTFVRAEQVNLSLGEIKAFFDPSLGKTSSDYPMIIWIHSYEDQLTVIDAIDKKIELSLIVHHIATKNKEYGCRHITFENNGISLIEQSLRDAHDRINHKMYFEPLHNSSSKFERICSIQPDLYSGRVRFMDDYIERYPLAMNQLIFFPVFGTDDFPDTLQMGISHFRRAHFKFVRYESCL